MPAPHPWREQLLAGVDTSDVGIYKGGPCNILVYGQKSIPVLVNRKGQVLMAATQYGKGRAILFANPKYAAQMERDTENVNRRRLFKNIKSWVSQSVKDQYSIKRWHKMDEGVEGVDILYGSGTGGATKETLENVLDFVYNGGGLVIGENGWAFKRNNPIAKLNFLPGFLGLHFTGEFIRGVQEYPSTPDNPGFVLGSIPMALDQFPEFLEGSNDNAMAMVNMFRVLPLAVCEELADDILRVLTENMEEIHHKPTASRPVKLPEEKALVAIMHCFYRCFDSVRGMQKLPCVKDFPGDNDCWPWIEVGEVYLTVPEHGMKCMHPTGWYAPAGTEIEIVVDEALEKGQWKVVIGCHDDLTWNTQEKWKRWPQLQTYSDLTQGTNLLSTAAGGLVYMKSNPETTVSLHAHIHHVVKAPLYDISSEASRQDWLTRRQAPGLWADLIGHRIQFTVPAEVVRELDAEAFLRFWDETVELDYELLQKSELSRKARKQWVVTDRQPMVGYMHSGYPIVTGLDVVPAPCRYRPSMVKFPCIMHCAHLMQFGNWGLMHEIGHNMQDDMWTPRVLNEVTCNLFTLYGMHKQVGIEPWEHKWVKNQCADAIRFLKLDPRWPKWPGHAGIGLVIYAQLIRDFGWESYKKVFAEYNQLHKSERPKTDEDRMHQWIFRFSKVVSRNLIPFFKFWHIPVEERTVLEVGTFLQIYQPDDEITRELPEWTAEIWPDISQVCKSTTNLTINNVRTEL